MKRVSIIGCGFVANAYMLTLSKSKTLQVAGVLDHLPERAQKLAQRYSVPRIYDSLLQLLADDSVEIVLNLTNPRDHYETTKACLEAGKHVYSEKPMAMTVEEAKHLVEIAEAKSLQLSSAPCSLLGETAQTIWKALREDEIGRVRLVYAELECDLIHLMQPENWINSLGAGWPAKDEYEIGCTIEHAGYYLAWLVAFFGPAKTVTAFGACLIPDKIPGVKLDPPNTPDFSVACIEFQSGTVARLTCGIVGPHDHSLDLVGDTGILHIGESWNFGAPIHIRPRCWNGDRGIRSPLKKLAIRGWRKMVRHLNFLSFFERFTNPHGRVYPSVREVPKFEWQMGLRMDLGRGVEELAASIEEKRESRLSTRFSLHVAELVLAIHQARSLNQTYQMTTTVGPVEPMPWAK